ncbi:MAG: hypothetical protein DRP76_03415 [Candidatus Omnitrophota bacterium]|nr:MAG: hypothetical protein DRP76_03415 [Candidatus Omnitrophota bacterium]
MRKKLFLFFNSSIFRIFFIVFGFLLLIFLRLKSGFFEFSLGYFYIVLVALTGFWFGIKGGLIGAGFASLIFVFEVNIFKYWAFRDLAVKNMFFRFFIYFLTGLGLGYLSNIEKKLKESLKNLAYYDELTRCINFRWTMKILEKEIDRAARYKKELSIIMVDIDHFKKINDTYGHLAGNFILKEFARIVKENVRNIDVVGRYGGEEFLIILPEAGIEEAKIVSERIREKLSQKEIKIPNSSDVIKIKFSAGIACFPYNGKTINELIGVADNALYQAKRKGRNRVVWDRRRWIRITPLSSVRLEIIGDRETKILNISSRGALLLFPEKLEEKELLCHIHFSDKESYKIPCKVIHQSKHSAQLYKVGVYFVEPLPKI